VQNACFWSVVSVPLTPPLPFDVDIRAPQFLKENTITKTPTIDPKKGQLRMHHKTLELRVAVPSEGKRKTQTWNRGNKDKNPELRHSFPNKREHQK
jgi:hypothetical protein